MRFIEIINQKKFTLISMFLFLYVILNLLDGERGLISFYEKKKISIPSNSILGNKFVVIAFNASTRPDPSFP